MFKGIKKLLGSGRDQRKWYPVFFLILLVGSLLLGVLARFLAENLGSIMSGGDWSFRLSLLTEARTWLVGFLICGLFTAIIALNGGFRGVLGKSLLSGDAAKNVVEGRAGKQPLPHRRGTGQVFPYVQIRRDRQG